MLLGIRILKYARRRLPIFVAAVASVFALTALASTALAVKPSSPEVQALVKSALAELEKPNQEDRLGGKCVIALAFVKADQPDHPRVAEAVAACGAAARAGNAQDVYSNGLAVIFLCELNATRHRSLIDFFLGALKRRQKDHGGWGYDLEETGWGFEQRPTGDTSQTQYASLAYWEAHAHGISVGADSAELGLEWLLDTQDPSGGWGYQGKIAESSGRVEQQEITCSMVSAGMSSVLIFTDMFGRLRGGESQTLTVDVPSALKRAGEKSSRRSPDLRTDEVDWQRVFATLKLGKGWMDENYKESIGRYTNYYLYALERYKSFEEVLEGESPDEPDWYNNGSST